MLLCSWQMDGVKKTLLIVVLATLTTHGFDCLALTTPEQAMQCCNSMPCAPGGHHGQDCCKTMPSINGPFLQPQHTSIEPDVHVVGAATSDLTSVQVLLGESVGVSALSHAPPIRYSSSSPPIRI